MSRRYRRGLATFKSKPRWLMLLSVAIRCEWNVGARSWGISKSYMWRSSRPCSPFAKSATRSLRPFLQIRRWCHEGVLTWDLERLSINQSINLYIYPCIYLSIDRSDRSDRSTYRLISPRFIFISNVARVFHGITSERKRLRHEFNVLSINGRFIYSYSIYRLT